VASFVVNGDPKPGVDLVKKHTRVYRLPRPPIPAHEIRQRIRQDFGTVAPADYAFWDLLKGGAGEPGESLDPIRLGFFASVGIEKGKTFARSR
jgi:hypothetical protein